jgi:hypothetical protein
MAETVINTFDLYNTTRYWYGYNFPGYTTEQQVASAYYATQFSSQPLGSQVDFFINLAEGSNSNIAFNVYNTTIDSLPYLWGKYWWDKAVYYSNSTVFNTLTARASEYYQPFSESVGSLYYISRVNNLQNEYTKVYNPIIAPLISLEISEAINTFYTVANDLFLNNKSFIGPGTGTDTNPGSGANGTLIQADTDLTRRITSNQPLTATINNIYSKIYMFLPFNTNVLGNQLTPFFWSLTANCENTTINVDFTNRDVIQPTQLVTGDLVAK